MNDIDKLRLALMSNFLAYAKYFFPLISSYPFQMGNRAVDENHINIICDALERVYVGEIKILEIDVPPGFFKSTLLILWVTWCLAKKSGSAFIYGSYSKTLAKDKTRKIRNILEHPVYQRLFNTKLSPDSTAVDLFHTTDDGGVLAGGLNGTITGFDAGKPFSDEFTGALIIDDGIKPEEAFSSTVRENVKRVFDNTCAQRLRSSSVPIINLNQRTHADDLGNHIINLYGDKLHHIKLKGLCDDGKSLCEGIRTTEATLLIKENDPYTFWSQHQQEPISIENALFEEKDFIILDNLPDLNAVFIVGDTAETDKKTNAATAFTAWGVFDLERNGEKTEYQAIALLGCIELWVKPDQLEKETLKFYGEIEGKYGKPDRVSIENKSTGVMLNACLSNTPGIHVVPIMREPKFSKIDRIERAQPFCKKGQVCILKDNIITNNLFVKHMLQIMMNGEALRYDIADTCADAVNIALIKKSFSNTKKERSKNIDLSIKSFRSKLGGASFGQARY